MQKMKKKYNGIMRLVAVLLTLVLSLSYVPTVEAAAKSSNVKSVTVTNLPANTLTLKKGKSMTLKVKVESTNKKKASQKVTYKSSNSKVATVTSKGKVTAKKKGTATITITSKANTKKNTKIKVSVGTPVTSVSLNKTSATVQTGQSITLKATVKPKKPTNKGIVWSSSNSAIATVNSKGKVTTLKAGTVKITAEAADGSGKKKTATITVMDPIVVNEVSVINDATVRVTLSGASDLTAGSFTVKSNMYGGSKYNKVHKIDNISSTENKMTYLVVLDSESRLSDHDHVQVTVTGLWGSAESVGTAIFNDGTFTYDNEQIYTGTVGERINQEFYSRGYGYSAFSVTNLPSGIQYEEVGDYIRFYGKPQQAGNFLSQVVEVDEAENTYVTAITWSISSKDTITATVSGTKYYLLQSDGTASIRSLRVEGHGGSGSYKYSLVGATYELTIDENNGYISGTLRGRGDYPLSVRVEDRNDPAKVTTAEVTIHVEQSVTVSGIVKDLGGNPITSNVHIRFINKDKATKYGRTVYADNTIDDNTGKYTGAFSATLVSGTYDIVATCGTGNGETASYLYSQELTTTRSGFDITLQVRKVNIYSNDPTVKAEEFGNWEDANGEVYGSGDCLYLKEGTYNLTTTRKKGRLTITATISVTVSADTSSTTANVAITDNVQPISAEVPVAVSLTDEYTYYSFTAPTTATYYFYSTNRVSGDPEGILEDASGMQLRYDDDESRFSDEYNFYYSYDCVAGTTYYIGVRVRSNSGTATLNVSATNPIQQSSEEEELYNSGKNAEVVEQLEEAIEDEEDITPEEPTEDAEVVDQTEEPAAEDEAVDETEEPAEDGTAHENLEELIKDAVTPEETL